MILMEHMESWWNVGMTMADRSAARSMMTSTCLRLSLSSSCSLVSGWRSICFCLAPLVHLTRVFLVESLESQQFSIFSSSVIPNSQEWYPLDPSGKLGKSRLVEGKTHYQWPFSIAYVRHYQRITSPVFWRSSHLLNTVNLTLNTGNKPVLQRLVRRIQFFVSVRLNGKVGRPWNGHGVSDCWLGVDLKMIGEIDWCFQGWMGVSTATIIGLCIYIYIFIYTL